MMKFTGTILAAAAMVVATPALAVTHVLSLTGSVANSSFNSFQFNGSNYNTWELLLDGLQPLQLNVGDEIDATVTLDGAFTVPASDEAFVGLNLFQVGGASPLQPVSNDGTMTFSYSMGTTGLPSDTLLTNCGNCASNIAFFGANAPFTFDGLHAVFTITDLSDVDYLIDGASMSYQLRTAAGVPEPATWAMMILGFGMIGGLVRRRKQATKAVSAANATHLVATPGAGVLA